MQNIFFRFAQLVNCPDSPSDAAGCNTTLPQVNADSGSLGTILTIVFGTITAVAVLIIAIQGVRYVLSYGEPEKTTQARKGIIYAVAGLIVVFMADIIVAFVLGRL